MLSLAIVFASLAFIPSCKGIYFTNGNSLSVLSRNEELPVGTFIIKAETDQPADSFDITGTAATYFAINSTGHIYIKQRIDREALSNVIITGTVKATKSGSADATTSFVCIITDINDNVPSYPKRLYEVTISESSSIGTEIFKEKAIDGDEGQNGGTSYAIASGNEIGKFQIYINTGVVELLARLDYESEKEYNLNITVKDGPGLTNWTILVIHVSDADDLPARFTSYAYSTSVKEDASMGVLIYQVQAYDLDKGINGTVTYAIDQDSNPSRLFAINNSTGVISLNGSLDRETVDEYVVRVLALSSFPVSDHATVTIKITDVNDNKPVFSQSTYNGTVLENMASGTMVVQVTATDKDTGINAQLRYSIQAGVDSNRFTIDHQTGKISTAVGLDREDKDSYVLTVVVQDMNGNSSLGTVYNDTVIVYITIKDVNDNAPVLTNSTYATTINESLPIGSSVIQVEAKDPDIDQDIVYTISKGNELGRFLIGGYSGVISIKTLIDRDAPNNEKAFNLKVTATDEKNAAMKSTATVTIIIEDINDNQPHCGQDEYRYSVQENAAINTVVAALNCTDLDEGDNGRISYRILSGAQGKFSLNTTTGSFEISAALDYESVVTYTIKVEVKDHGNPQRVRVITIIITVTNVNDNVPQFSKQKYEFSIFESDYSANAALVGQVDATDKDADSNGCSCGKIRYSIENTTGVFTIDELTGFIKTSRVFDREVTSNYTIVVKATDQDPLNPLANTSDVTVHVIDVNDNSPVFSQSSYSSNVSEAATLGQNVIKVLATDRDIGSNANINYTISSGNHGNAFSIDDVTGQIKVALGLDRETFSRYDLVVVATDGGQPRLKATVPVTIHIIDVDDHDPVCAQNNVTVRIKENLAPEQIVTTISITDQDKGIQETTIFSLQSDSFAVNPSTGVVNTTRSLDREDQSQYSLIIQANQSAKAVNCLVHVIVEDENDNTPSFNVSTYSLEVIENTTIDTPLLRVTATDKDVSYNGDVIYSIIGDGTKFSINSTTGIIRLISSLDRETTSQYTIQVIATDRGLPQSLSSTMILTINVTDVNDNSPVFSENIYRGEIAENLINTRVLDVTAEDKDDGLNGQVVYSITAGNTGNAFNILSNGTIKTVIPLDREVKDRYELTVEAADRGVPAKTTSVQVIVTVLDVNDNAPNITNAPASITIPENTPIGSPVLSLLSEDKDVGINADVKYIGYAVPAGVFAIDQTTGTIKVIGQLDREQIPNYKFHAVATDAGSPPLNSSEIQFEIIIADVNDNNPVFNPIYFTANISEGLSSGTFVAIVNASEKDAGKFGQISYKIKSGDPNGDFSINNETGVITTKKKLDRESVAKYSMVISAMDHGNPPRAGYAYVTVHVIDSNDLPPVFSLSEYFASSKEDVSIGTSIIRVTATDGDLGSNAEISFTLISGHGIEDFNITTKSEAQSGSLSTIFIGLIKTARNLDRESRARYNLTVLASDGQHNVTAQVIITVQDVNDNPPVFNMTGQRTNITIDENTPGGTEVLRVKANNKDEGANAKITYSIQGDEGKFSIDSISGILYTSPQNLDRETKDFYNLTITATDPGNNKASLSITVHVLDINDNAPKFNQSTYTVDVGEGNIVYDVIANDNDKGANQEIRYSIIQGNEDGLFQIDNTTGRVISTRPLDREESGIRLDQSGRAIHFLVITAADQGTPKLFSTANVIIRVSDNNDNNPVFDESSYSFTVAENVSLGHIVGRVTASDKDYGNNAIIEYSITTQGIPFAINSSSGDIRANGSLDRETVSFYQLTVKASDKGNPRRSSTVMVKITITDINDNRPVLNQSEYHVIIPENTLGGHVVIILNAKDDDKGMNAELRFALVEEKSGKFSISEISGAIRSIGSFDYKTSQSYTLNVSVTDRGDPPLQSFALVYVNITNINDNKPQCSQAEYRYSVQENATVNTVVASLNCSDLDAGDNGRISYRILSGADGKFSIDAATGSIATNDTLDYEIVAVYIIQVEVRDQGNSQHTIVIVVIITVQNINDNAPQFSNSTYNFYISEGDYSFHSVLVGNVVATDKDADSIGCPCGRIRYSIVNATGVFTIDEMSGHIRTSHAFDREVTSSYTLAVKATDQDPSNQLVNKTEVIVHLIDVNDNSPAFSQSSYSANVSEAATPGQDVIKVAATDRDAGSNANITYTISSGNHGNVFSIDEISGQIKVATVLDRETRSRYELVIAAADGGVSRRKTTVVVAIEITDVDDHDPVCAQNNVTVRIKENLAPGQLVTTVSITDQDKAIKKVTIFSLQSDSFDVNPSTGVVNTTRSLDREDQSQYSLVIQAYYYNQSAKAVNCSVRVIVEDVNDNTPSFNVSSYSLNVIENTTVGTTLFRVAATDGDDSYNGDVIYSIIGDGTKFSINSTSGILTLISSLDRETTSHFIIRVLATDRGLPHALSSTMMLSINVTDVNDNRPVFSEKVYRGEIAENLINTRVLDVTAEDKDDGLNGQVVYSITAGNIGNAFQILSNGTIITVTPLDREERDRYEVTVEAADKGVPAKTTSVQVIVNVLDVNDNAPNITNAPASITIPENTPIGSTVFALLSEDKDAGINADVRFIGYAVPAGGFAIDQSTGTIKVIGLLDREQISSYNFAAVSIDRGSPKLNSSTIQFNIIIADVNDNNPVFNPVSYTSYASEGLSPGAFVTNVNATEKDEGSLGQITYKIESGDSNEDFSINNETGVIVTIKELDRESVAKYSLVVTAMDHGNPPRVGYAYVTINVIDANDLSPVFSLNEYYATAKEDITIGTSVTRVTATDGDLGSNAEISYSLSGGDGMDDFNITTKTVAQGGSQSVLYIGLLTTAKGLDRETRDGYNLSVTASDGQHNVTTRVIITVQDVNDNSPVFNMTGQRTNITINENTPGGTEVLRVMAYDKDGGTNGKITYSIQGDDGKFSIDANSGILYTSPQNLDREVKDLYNLTITAADPGNNKASLSITVHVLDVNDNVPKFNQSRYTVDVGEGNLVYDVIATDNDQGANQEIRYSIVQGNEDGLFHIDNTTGRATSTRPLDREEPGLRLDQKGRGIYFLVVEAANQGSPKLFSTANIIVRVSDNNDNSPLFDQSSYSFTVAENVLLGHNVGRVAAKDKDYGDNAFIEYSIITQDVPFMVNASTGDIALNGSLDRETVPSYQLTVKASDKGIPRQSSTANVTIRIDDVNDNRPMFNQSAYHVTVPENTVGGHLVMVLNAKDDDEGINGDIRFAMVDGSREKFVLSELSGAIRTIGILDYETSQSYILNLSVTDRGNPPLQSFALVYINITDINDNIPVFNESKSVVNVSEDVVLNHTIVIMKATDVDSDDNGKVSYSLVDDVDGTFAINKNGGEIINLKQLDYEARTVYKLHVNATDGGAHPLSSTFILTVNIVDVNDNAPRFLQDFYFTVSPDAIVGRLIGSVQARDKDSGLNGRLKFILNNRQDIFKLNDENGDLLLVSSVAALANQNLTLSVTCQDGGSPPLSANGTVYVYIGEGLRYTTRLVPRHINVSIYENETVGYLVATLNSSNSNNIEYQLLEENNGKFVLNSSTGEIRLVSSLDRETTSIFKIFVAVRDRSERVNSDYGTVIITVLDVNDNPPTFVQTPIVLPIPENSKNGTFVARVQATDPDEGINQQIFYYIKGETSNTFSINNITGVVTTKISLDFETNPIYNMTVIAENSLSPVRLRSYVSFNIPIKDVLDFIPRFTSSLYRTSVPEDIALGSEVIDMNATTHDQYSMYVVYRIVHNESSQDSYHFSIAPESGVIRTQNGLDRETNSNYSLYVEARDIRDPVVYKASTTVIVTVTDVNDNVPVFKNKTIRFSPMESLGVGDVIGRIEAIDRDDGDNAGILFEIISGNDLGYCAINETTGDLYIVKLLDYESVPSITLTVRAYDKQRARRTRRNVNTPPYSDVTVTISIQDVNDNPPVFDPAVVFGRFYPENPDNTVVATIQATDKDSNSVIKFNAFNQSHSGTLVLNSQTGHVTRIQSNTPLSIHTYTMEVTAKDNDGVMPYNNATNKATVVVFQLTDDTSLTLTIGLPISLVRQNQHLLISLLKNITGEEVVLKSLQKSPEDSSTTLAVIHLIDYPNRKVLTRDQATSIFTSKKSELDERLPEWKIKVHSSSSATNQMPRRAYFSAYIGALIAFAVLIGIVGLCAILVVCRYKYREKNIEDIEQDQHHDPIIKILPWTYLRSRFRRQTNQSNSVGEEYTDTPEPAYSTAPTENREFTPTITNPNDITITNLEDANVNHGFEGTSDAFTPPITTQESSETPRQDANDVPKRLDRQDSVKRVRFDLTDDLGTSTADGDDDDNDYVNSDLVPDILYSALQSENVLQRDKNEDKTDVLSAEYNGADNQQQDNNLSALDDHSDPTRIKHIDNDIKVTSL